MLGIGDMFIEEVDAGVGVVLGEWGVARRWFRLGERVMLWGLCRGWRSWSTFVTDRKLTYFGVNFLNMFKKNPIQSK